MHVAIYVLHLKEGSFIAANLHNLNFQLIVLVSLLVFLLLVMLSKPKPNQKFVNRHNTSFDKP